MLAWQWVQKTHPKLLIFHVPNGEARDIRVAQKLKRMGVLPGVADFLVFTPGDDVAIEMKNADGEQGGDQERFQKKWEACGKRYVIARTLDEFKMHIEELMCPYPWATL